MTTLMFAPLFMVPGIGELLIIAFIVTLMFGAKKLPELLGGMGRGIMEFKKGVRWGKDAVDEVDKLDGD